jgi:pimeloyl-ACP methyl ester carboxylesterase
VTSAVHLRQGGSGSPVLLLLHGLGGTAEVWDGVTVLLDERWPGSWVTVDLPGHGRSAPLPRYTFDGLSAAVAPAVAEAVSRCAGSPDPPLTVLGHSLGGVVGLALAGGGHGLRVHRVVGLGIKVAWSETDLARAKALADRPPAVFATRDEAVARHLAVSGLRGLLPPESAAVGSGVREVDGGWGLALDPRATGVGAPDLPALLAASQADVLLARGEHDPMVSDADLAALQVRRTTLPGLGHSAHVEDPVGLVDLLLGQR